MRTARVRDIMARDLVRAALKTIHDPFNLAGRKAAAELLRPEANRYQEAGETAIAEMLFGVMKHLTGMKAIRALTRALNRHEPLPIG